MGRSQRRCTRSGAPTHTSSPAGPLLLSGDCPAALGAVAGLQSRYHDLAVVWLDTHGDFNTPATTASGYLRFPSGPGPSVTQIEECLAAVCAAADVKAAGIACAWLPDRVSDHATREAITRLAGALGADLAWQTG